MRMPDWRNSIFEEGVLPEPIADHDRIVLWLPDDRDERFRYWERVGNVARATITAGEGHCATAATSIRARQKIHGPLGKLFSRLRGTTGDRTLMVPDGETVEAWGGRRTDLLLVWVEDEDDARPLDEARIRSRWPESQRIRELGKNLFLVSGIEPRPAKTEAVPEPVPPEGNPLQVAEQRLVAARATGDPREEVSALADLGLIHREQGDAPRAVVLLEEAAALARQLGDRVRECDVLGNLGLATLAVGQPSRARQLI